MLDAIISMIEVVVGSVYKEQLNRFVSELDIKANILLDWGGSQNPIKGRTNTWDVGNYKIVDLATPHVETKPPDIVQDANKPLDGDIKKYIGRVDVLIALGIMDYVICPNIAMESISRLLKDGGYAWIEWPLFYCIHNPIEDEGCRYSEGCIKRLCKQSNLKIDEIIYKPAGNGHLVEFFRQDGQRMAKGVDHNTVGYITRLSKQ